MALAEPTRSIANRKRHNRSTAEREREVNVVKNSGRRITVSISGTSQTGDLADAADSS
jgi:hypothetical protein